MRRTAFRLVTTLVVVMSLLSMQLALAAYVCPSAASDDVALQMPCEDMGATPQSDEQQPALCHQHCTNAAQSFEPIKLPTLTLPAVLQVLVVPLRVDHAAREARVFAVAGEAQPPPSPVFLSTLRLRV